MPAPTTTLLIEGSFEELADELAHYVDNLKKTHGDESSNIQSEIQPLLQDDKKVDTLKKIVAASSVLNSAPEKEFVAAYNLLIHLVHQSGEINTFLPRICGHLSAPITSSPVNGPGLALSALSTIFNTLDPDDDVRYHVFLALLRVVRSASAFDALKSQLKHIDDWIKEWDISEADTRKVYMALSDVAGETGETDTAYEYLIRALRTIEAGAPASSPEARGLALKALKAALVSPTHFDFQDLTALDAIQALRKSDPTYYELLELFTSEGLDDFNDFKDEHDGWIESEGLDAAALNRKMRLLTLASLAASAHQTRSLPYERIAKALQIPKEDVEMWVIDVIRAGLVEGKLSQLNQTFLIHRSTYRVFGENQWREVASRLDMWRTSLIGVLGVIKNEKEAFIQQKQNEVRELEAKMSGAGLGSGGGGGGGKRHRAGAQVAAGGAGAGGAGGDVDLE
ncbi:eukaryotic translation initiation factor 3 subunit M [Lineolata rhizophorae]|uniref:Eukaryotic translation initiation factor 3 subunit M n=1 Tax=Lineolata rhizophorae TaxID=578093 RepID=A0A6A6NT11_9PEZI|nr:eukaryotic translation initiation factor 3 subunit M [Lineolata rhizophorae]